MVAFLGEVLVSGHALRRWRERGSAYADSGPAELLEALRGARLLGKGEPLPGGVPRLPGSTYLALPGGTLIVLDVVSLGRCKVVTVIRPEQGRGRPKGPPRKKAWKWLKLYRKREEG